jgi:hypothetical protein
MDNNKNTHKLKSPSGDLGVMIEKYFEGLTSLEEEQLLCDYFKNEDIPEALKMYQPMFQFFSEEKAAVGKKMISLHTKESKRKNIFRYSIAVAASLLLLFALKPVFNTHKTLPETSQAYIDGKKYTNIELIQSEALKALENFSAGNDDVYSSQIEALDLFLDNN